MRSASALARAIIEPISASTARLLKPTHLQPTDRLHVDLTSSGELFTMTARGSSGARVGWLMGLPGRRELDGQPGVYQAPATDFTSLFIDANWPAEQVEFTHIAKAQHTYNLLRFLQQSERALLRSRWKIERFVPEALDWERKDRPLESYQRIAALTSINNEASALFMEQGTGKTYPTIVRIMTEAYEKARKRKGMYHALVLCPKNVRMNWEREVQNFATRPGKVTVIRGHTINRMKLLIDAMRDESDCEYSIVVCSYDTMVNDVDLIAGINWDLAVADESHLFKWHRTRRWQALEKLRDSCSQRMALTGTPICNNAFDIWTQWEWLGKGLSGFNTYRGFKEYYGKFVKTGAHIKHTGYDNLPLFQERYVRLGFAVRKDEVLTEIPMKQYVIRETSMSPKQEAAYSAISEQLLAEIDADSAAGRTVSAQNVLVKLLRLAQVTSGFVGVDAVISPTGEELQAREIRTFDPIPKLDELMSIISELQPKSKAIVWATFIPDIRAISQRLTAAGIKHVTFTGSSSDEERADAEFKFNNDPETIVFLGNPACCKEGINLRGFEPNDDKGTNCDTVVYYSQDWSMIKRAQSEDRAHRRGTRVPIQYIDLVVPGTIDEEIRVRVVDKRADAITLQDVTEMMQRILRTHRKDTYVE